MLQVLHQPINRHVEKEKAKMREILEKEGRDFHYSIFISPFFFLLKCLGTCTHTTLGQISHLTGKKPSRYIYLYENFNTLL